MDNSNNSNGKMERKVPVQLGQVFITPAAMNAIDPLSAAICLTLHRGGDWGEVCEEDRETNNQALKYGGRLLSVYSSMDGVTFWIITEADRSSTTILLPEDY
jgi:hypothetical protein